MSAGLPGSGIGTGEWGLERASRPDVLRQLQGVDWVRAQPFGEPPEYLGSSLDEGLPLTEGKSLGQL